MSWFSSKKVEVQPPLEQDFNVDLEIPFNEEDLNDQSLLDELRELQGGNDNPVDTKPKMKAKPEAAPEVHVDDIIHKVQLEAEVEPVVEFHEDDMNDPELLKELQAVTPESASTARQGNEPISPSSFITSPNTVSAKSPVVITTPEVALDSKLKSTDIAQLQKFIHVEKMKALNKKRAGDKAGALESLKVAKEMERRVLELQSLSPVPQETQISIPKSTLDTKVELDIEEKQDISPEYDVGALNTRMIEFKKLALAFKRDNNLAQAREMLSTAKSIQKALDTVAEGLPLVDFVLPSLPVIQSATTQDLSPPPIVAKEEHDTNEDSLEVKSAVSPPVNDNKPTAVPANELILHLITTLESQISTCTKLSAQYFTSNQKDLALEYHKKKKGFLQDKQTLAAMKSIVVDPNSLPFRFSYSEHSYQMNQSFLDIPLDKVEISIVKASDVFVKGVLELETVVTFDFGWPSNATGTLNEGKGETTTVKGLHPEYQLKNLIPIERSKPFQRFLERKKATFELFYFQKSMFGLMASRVSYGKASIKLDDLLSKCEIHQILPLMDPANPRKTTGSNLEIRIRMRAPLIKPDVINVSEQWLTVVFGESSTVQPSAVSVLPSNALNSTKQDGSTRAISTAEKNTPLSTNATKNTSPVPTRSSPTLANTKSDVTNRKSPTITDSKQDSKELEIDELAQAFLMPENIASNAVLEHEHKLVIQQIAQGNKSEELQDLKSSYEIKMNMLVTSIQLGTLDMPGYLSLVKNSISKTKTLALTFKKANRIDLAKKALVRVKIMTSEVDEVESQ